MDYTSIELYYDFISLAIGMNRNSALVRVYSEDTLTLRILWVLACGCARFHKNLRPRVGRYANKKNGSNQFKLHHVLNFRLSTTSYS